MFALTLSHAEALPLFLVGTRFDASWREVRNVSHECSASLNGAKNTRKNKNTNSVSTTLAERTFHDCLTSCFPSFTGLSYIHISNRIHLSMGLDAVSKHFSTFVSQRQQLKREGCMPCHLSLTCVQPRGCLRHRTRSLSASIWKCKELWDMRAR